MHIVFKLSQEQLKGKNISLLAISQGYYVPNSHTYNEAMDTILFWAECAYGFADLSKLDEICHFVYGL